MAHVKSSSLYPEERSPGNPKPFSDYAEYWRPIFAHARECVLLLRLNGAIVEANPAAVKTFGGAFDDLRGCNLADLLDPRDVTVVQQRLTRLDHDEASFYVLGSDRDRNAVPVEFSARRVEFGDETFLLCTMRSDNRSDIGARDHALAAIVTTSDDAIVGKLLDGTVTSWNPAAERLYGWSAAEIVGHPISRIVPEDRLEELREILARLGRGERIDHHETVRVARDGRRIEVSISISPIRDESGRVIGAAKIARDVTDRRRLERQQREFLLLAAHELRTPVTSLKVSAQMLERRTGRDDQLIGWISNRITHLGLLVDDLVDAARFESGPLLHRSEVDLAAIASVIVDGWQMRSERHSIRLETTGTPIVGDWDRTRIEQVIANLLDNAIAYSPGGEITVHVARREDIARIVVSDQGPGIPAQLMPALFQRFVRLEEPGMNTVPGLGLGLFICRTLVEAHGGRIWAESAPPSGASFVIELPLESGA
jgi:PAS domain S-box-containing protein